MNFTQLQAEVIARGFNFQDSTRVALWVNLAHAEVCDQEDWPFLQASATGPVPLTIADLGVIEAVTRSDGVKLAPADRRQLAEDYQNLTQTGSASFYFVTPGPAVSVFPASTAPVTVRYWKVPADLVAGSDVPVFPARFHELIVLGALRRAMLEESDASDYQAVDAEWQRGLQTMRERVLLWHRDGNFGQVMSAGHGDV